MSKLSLLLPLKIADLRIGQRFFYAVLLVLCLSYFSVETYVITHSIFTVDDFWLSYHTYHYKAALPYRDFSPYKTVLGYYVMLLPMLVTHNPIASMLAIKIFLTVLNTLGIAVAGWWLKKFFTPSAVLLALALVVSTFFFVACSSEIRVDLLAYWLCLFSLCSVLEKKWLSAGCFIGLAFMVSQKALWSLVAMDCAVLASAGWRMTGPLLRMNGVAAALLSFYLLLWSCVASFHTVLHNVFYEAYLIAHIKDYQGDLANFWKFSLHQNIVIYLASAFGLLSLLIPPLRPRTERIFMGAYALIMAAFFISYQQPFAYHPLMLLPAILLLVCILCEWVLAVFTSPLARLVFGVGILASNLSLITSTYLLTAMDNHYQLNMLALMEQLLNEDENYIAGAPLSYLKNPIIPGLTHLTTPQINYLYQPTPAASQFMLASLYLAPTTQAQILVQLMDAPIKFYINNNRIQSLPPALKSFLASEYQHFWGSIYLYAPTLPSGQQTILIKFTGYYKIRSPHPIMIDGKIYLPSTMASFTRGSHSSIATTDYRLQLVPEIPAGYLDFKFVKDDYPAMLG